MEKIRILIVMAIFMLMMISNSGCNAENTEFGKSPILCPAISYKPTGKETRLSTINMTIYETGNLESNRILIAIYDVFGFHTNTKQVADQLGKLGDYHIVMPDFYRGDPISLSVLEQHGGLEILKKWIETHGTWNLMKPSIEAVLKHYNKDMVEFGLFGFCWGGNTSLEVGTELTKSVKAVAIVHPFLVETEQASNRINTPVLVLPSHDEPDYSGFYKNVKARLGASNIEVVRFEDMFHGFSSARGNFTDVINKERAEQVIILLNNFFNRHMIKSAKSESRHLYPSLFITMCISSISVMILLRFC